MPYMRRDPSRLVFVDETSINTKMARLRGWAPVGQRLEDDVPFGHWISQTFIAGLTVDGVIAPWVLDGAMDRAAFDTYVGSVLAPAVGPGDVVILDNLSAHKSPGAAQVLAEQGAWMLFLPPYSPDLNPIEMAFSKLKAHLRRLAVRSFDALWRAVGDVCDLFSPDECLNFFHAAGYGEPCEAAAPW